MGAATSAERAGKSEEDATTNEEQSEAVDDEIQEGDEADAKVTFFTRSICLISILIK